MRWCYHACPSLNSTRWRMCKVWVPSRPCGLSADSTHCRIPSWTRLSALLSLPWSVLGAWERPPTDARDCRPGSATLGGLRAARRAGRTPAGSPQPRERWWHPPLSPPRPPLHQPPTPAASTPATPPPGRSRRGPPAWGSVVCPPRRWCLTLGRSRRRGRDCDVGLATMPPA